MKGFSFATLFIASVVTVGCSSPASKNPNDYVGEYVFMPKNAVPGQFASFVILKKDQSAVEIRFSKNTDQVQITRQKWYLTQTTSENVVIGDFSHPVEGSSSALKLGINDDLGQYYEKVR
ncbi:MAG TPA: hypothetical protein VMU48_00375 [Terracidiphilus sp.]|nr:hypothetical protein [Terracidiphilus sp.]